MLLLRAAVLCVATTILAGCAVLTADGERLGLTSPEFRAYVERVFREQNRVADQFAFALEAVRDAPSAVTAAEQSLLDACAALNELATARRDERQLSLSQRSTAARSAPGCERTVRASVATLDAWQATRP
ncbi:MAG: hypothetical protein ABI640_08625 [Gammaproteobacteria bacterium]